MTTHHAAPHRDALLTARGLARAIRGVQPAGSPGVGEGTILRAIRAGRLPAMRTGRWYRVRWADWLAYVAASRIEPADPQATPAGDAVRWAAERIARESEAAS